MMKLLLACDGDQAILDLVAHFLGIATHHNINAAPSSAIVALPSTVRRALLSSKRDYGQNPFIFELRRDSTSARLDIEQPFLADGLADDAAEALLSQEPQPTRGR